MSSISSRYNHAPMLKNMLNYMHICQLYDTFVSYMVFACDDVPHCCKGAHAKTIQVYLNANTCGSYFHLYGFARNTVPCLCK